LTRAWLLIGVTIAVCTITVACSPPNEGTPLPGLPTKTATVTSPTQTATVCIGGGDCGTPAIPPTATVTATPIGAYSPTPTATPQPTCAACPTCPPQLTGDLVLRCFLDNDDDKVWGAGDIGIMCHVSFGYDIGLQTPIYYEVWAERGIWAGALLPGVYTVLVREYEPSTGIVPWFDAPGWAFVNAGSMTMIDIPFDDYARRYSNTPTPLPDYCPTCPDRTPTATRAAPSATPNSATKTKAAGG
jgi:hypothetical protein